MSIKDLIPLVESLPQADKFQLMQFLLSNIARNEGISLQDTPDMDLNRGPRMAEILQRMADRNALSEIADPVAWQKAIRADRPLLGRE